MIILRDPSLVRKMSTACGANSGTCFVAALALDSPRSFLKNTIVYIPRDPSQNGYRLRCLIQEPALVAALVFNLAQNFLKEEVASHAVAELIDIMFTLAYKCKPKREGL